MPTLLVYFALIVISAIAKIEQLVSPSLFSLHKSWMINYRFDGTGWFCRLCKRIPTECPAARIGLPPLCKLNPLFDQIILLQLKAADPEHQDEWIQVGQLSL